MNKKIVNHSFLFIVLICIGILVTIGSLSNSYSYLSNAQTGIIGKIKTNYESYLKPYISNISKEEESEIVTIDSGNCTSKEPLKSLDQSNDTSIKRLNQLQKICNSYVSNTQMIFIEMPNSQISATRLATSLSIKLKEFYKYGIKPVIIVEPVTGWGLIDFEEFSEGFYNDWLTAFFQRLKNENIESKHMGLWVPFPEANLPYWNRSNEKPFLFGRNVNIFSKLLKNTFNDAKVSILLNSVSYAADDYNWENGTYTSLIPYIKEIDPKSIESFGIQGFPWRSPSNNKTPLYIYDPLEFINPDIAIQAADFLKVKNIWINTGTFRAKYTNDPGLIITETSKLRDEILSEIVVQTEYIKNKGYNVQLNLFAENKANANEATDWSYWGNDESKIDEHTNVLKKFIKSLNEKDIELWYFDKQN
jgi:hypothetical protein